MYRKLEYYTLPEDTEITPEVLAKFLEEHKTDCKRFQYLRDMYEGRHPILQLPKKPSWKPDNRIVMNFAKYIVDTLCGYFIGIPVKTEHTDRAVQEEITAIRKYSDQDDNDAELAKICSIYGSGFELVYLDEAKKMALTYFSPMEAFIIYDDSVARNPLFGVRYYKNADGTTCGSVYTRSMEISFSDADGLRFGAEMPHGFEGVPLVEYIENEERQGAFEQVESIITAYEKAVSEKANDVDAFADAYLLLAGLSLEPEDIFNIRQDRVIYVPTNDEEILKAIRVEFLQKPSGDETQEHLLDRLEKQIFNISMVANISDEEFGGSSGTALAYKLQPMKNLAAMKARKFASGMNRRWRLIFSHTTYRRSSAAWDGISYHFTQNAPKNLLEEAQTASTMAGITSRKTQLSVISAVQDVQQELQEIETENGTSPDDTLRAERTQ